MKTIFKIVLSFSFFVLTSNGYSQNADLGIGIIMSPPTVAQGSTGILSANVGNYGNDNIVANSIMVTISVGLNAEIMGIAPGGDPRWVVFSMTTGSANTIKLTNAAGNFTPFDVGDILLTVRGNVISAPNLIFGNISYIPGTNPLLCGTCLNTSQGNALNSNDDSQTSITVSMGSGDSDGDGDPDSTDPNPTNPCIFGVGQVLANASATWNASDCDLDGNPNGTDPHVTQPVAQNDTLTAPFGQASSVNILANDDFLANDGNTITQAPGGTAGGVVTFDPITGIMSYTPLASESGNTVTIVYQVCQGTVCATASVTVTIPLGDSDGDGDPDSTDPNPTNPCIFGVGQVLANASATWNASDCDLDGNPNGTDPHVTQPVAQNDTLTAPFGQASSVNILANDDFLANDGNTITQAPGGTAGGVVTFDPITGIMSYTPLASESGNTVTIVYQVCQGTVCATASVIISVPCPIFATPLLSLVTQPTCNVSTGSFTITNYNATYTYTVTPSNGVNILGSTITAPAGSYTITASIGSCVSQASPTVIVNAQPSTLVIPTISSVTQPTCNVSTGSFTITNYNATYTYTVTPSIGVTILAGTVTAPAGSYTISSAINGCLSPITLPVVINPVNNINCSSIALIKTAQLDDINQDGIAQVGENIIYTFVITNTGLVPLTNITLSDPLPGILVTGGPISLGVGNFDSTSFSATYALTDQDIINGSVSNQATVFGTAPSGIIVNDLSDSTSNSGNSVTITEIKGCQIEVFNAVTPNNDGNNDYFYIRGLDCFTDNSVEIYNRWGVKVFETANYDNNSRVFKGYSEGRVTISQPDALPNGTYYYILKYKDINGIISSKTGFLYLTK
ncbi:gliding motility-associated C-terminal domain-containing protein [Flavobacterium sp.]|jgi:gliding motility-associated-like protein/uncharacterized repeat protein (TIGR01451 family)|uniref:T9SS type B sorting domain-containing protein n=1 Tax=Flavobacterium sp. TaxID=239 RepID=UPI0037C1AF75